MFQTNLIMTQDKINCLQNKKDIYLRVPSQYVLFALILWYVAKTLLRS